MEDFNIAEALKYAPKGLPLYSPLLGECKLDYCNKIGITTVRADNRCFTFHENGQYYENMGECLLFPSEGHRTWDNWQDLLLPQSIGCVCAYTGTIPQPTMFLCTSNRTVFSDNTGNTWDVLIGHSGNYLKSSRYATPEESKQFFDELKANGYEWDGKKKKLRKLQSDKFDISTLQPFDKVLVRDRDNCHWSVGLFAAYKQGRADPFICNAGWYSGWWKQCVPYNNNTEHLVGTTNDAPEFYKTWEYDE